MSENVPDVDQLLPCPFCGSKPRWCKDEDHECHLVVCTGCAISIDFQENPDTETVQELRDIMAAKWNRRASETTEECRSINCNGAKSCPDCATEGGPK